jgi:hypothetical protein
MTPRCSGSKLSCSSTGYISGLHKGVNEHLSSSSALLGS